MPNLYDNSGRCQYNLEQGQNMDVGDANFSCPADAADPCEVTVDEDGNVTCLPEAWRRRKILWQQ